MKIYVPFLTSKNNENTITPEMEIASALLYFELSKQESIKSFVTKQPKETVVWAARGYYLLEGRLFDREDKLYCLYDAVGLTGNAELECTLDFDYGTDIGSICSKDKNVLVDELKSLSKKICSRVKIPLETKGLIQCGRGTADTFRGKENDKLEDMTVDLKSFSIENEEHDTSWIKEVFLRLQQSVEEEINSIRGLCNMDDENFKASVNDRKNIYEEFEERIHKEDNEISTSISELIMERQDKIRDVEKIYLDKKSLAAEDHINNKNKYDIAKACENETEMGIYQRGMNNAEDMAKQLAKEENDEIRKIEKQYDSLLEDEKKRLELTISERELKIKQCEEAYNLLHSAIDGLKKALNEDIAVRKNQSDKIRGWLCKLENAENADRVEIYIPFYAAEYSGGRLKIFSPHVLEEKNQIMTLLSGIAGKVPMPFGERNGFLIQLFQEFQNYAEGTGKGAVLQLASGNLLARSNAGLMMEEGLKGLTDKGYINDKNFEKISTVIKNMFQE